MTKKKFIIFITLALIVLGIILIICFVRKKNNDYIMYDEEYKNAYCVSPNGASIYAFHTIPEENINKLKQYIINNNYNDSDIEFNYANNAKTYIHKFEKPGKQNNTEPAKYYIIQSYKEILVGYLVTDEDGNVIETHELKRAEELSDVPVEPEIDFNAAYIAGIKYLNLSEDALGNGQRKIFCYIPSKDKIVFCYQVLFENDKSIYINAITGEQEFVEQEQNFFLDKLHEQLFS